MIPSTRRFWIHAAIGVALFGLLLTAQVLLTRVLSPSGYASLGPLLPLYFFAAGLVVVWFAPQGSFGASAGVFVACAVLTLFAGGPAAQALGRAFGMAAWIALGELLGLALRHSSAKRAAARRAGAAAGSQSGRR